MEKKAAEKVDQKDRGSGKPPRHFSLLYRFAFNVARVPVVLAAKRKWYGVENLPKKGGFIAVSNHVSEFDSLTFMHFLLANGIPARVLVKDALYKVPVLSWIMRSTGQIPVHRSTKHAKSALSSAVKALKYGECIGLFPEGTLTRDPDYWPMKPKTGAARMALQAQVPVVPIAQWGAQDVLDRYSRKVSLFPRKTVTVRALEPIDLHDLYDRADDPEAWEEASRRIFEPIRQEISLMRGEALPQPIWDRKKDGDLGKKGFGELAKQWAKDEPGVLPSQRKTKHRQQSIDK